VSLFFNPSIIAPALENNNKQNNKMTKMTPLTSVGESTNKFKLMFTHFLRPPERVIIFIIIIIIMFNSLRNLLCNTMYKKTKKHRVFCTGREKYFSTGKVCREYNVLRRGRKTT